MKAVQVGFSEFALCTVISHTIRGRNVFYVLPTCVSRDRFVKARVNWHLATNAAYRSLAEWNEPQGAAARRSQVDAVALKALGPGLVTFVGSESPQSLTEFPADVLIVDDYDFCEQANLPLARDRIAHSEVAGTLYAGNPTIATFGISDEYEAGTANRWLAKCVRCNHWQEIDWFANIVEEESESVFHLRATGALVDGTIHDGLDEHALCVCAKCGRPLSRYAPGAWVAQHAGRQTESFALNQLICGIRPLAVMLADFWKALHNPGLLTAFHNMCLGRPHSAKGSRITEELLRERTGDHPRLSESDCYGVGGIDVGGMFNIEIIDEQNRIVFIDAVSTIGELDRIAAAFPNVVWVIDALPESRLVREWADNRPGQVFRCLFTLRDSVHAWLVDADEGVVKADRTQVMDAAYAALATGTDPLLIPRDALAIPDYVDQMSAPARILDPDKSPPVYRWVEGSRPDHYALAHTYAVLAREIRARYCQPMVTALCLDSKPKQ